MMTITCFKHAAQVHSIIHTQSVATRLGGWIDHLGETALASPTVSLVTPKQTIETHRNYTLIRSYQILSVKYRTIPVLHSHMFSKLIQFWSHWSTTTAMVWGWPFASANADSRDLSCLAPILCWGLQSKRNPQLSWILLDLTGRT